MKKCAVRKVGISVLAVDGQVFYHEVEPALIALETSAEATASDDCHRVGFGGGSVVY